MDVRLNEIYQTYETEWDDMLIVLLHQSLPSQLESYKHHYMERLKPYTSFILEPNVELGSSEDRIYSEYMSLALCIIWISVLRTLDIRVTYMVLQRTSIMFTQYLITYSQTK